MAAAAGVVTMARELMAAGADREARAEVRRAWVNRDLHHRVNPWVDG